MKFTWKKLRIALGDWIASFRWENAATRPARRFTLEVDAIEMDAVELTKDVSAFIYDLRRENSDTPIADHLLRLQTLVYHIEKQEAARRQKITRKTLRRIK